MHRSRIRAVYSLQFYQSQFRELTKWYFSYLLFANLPSRPIWFHEPTNSILQTCSRGFCGFIIFDFTFAKCSICSSTNRNFMNSPNGIFLFVKCKLPEPTNLISRTHQFNFTGLLKRFSWIHQFWFHDCTNCRYKIPPIAFSQSTNHAPTNTPISNKKPTNRLSFKSRHAEGVWNAVAVAMAFVHVLCEATPRRDCGVQSWQCVHLVFCVCIWCICVCICVCAFVCVRESKKKKARMWASGHGC